MKAKTGLLLLFGIFCAPMSVCLAQEPVGDAVVGYRLAAARCRGCHTAAPGMSQSVAGAPTFAEIANRNNTTPYRIQTFLSGRHGRMPDYLLSSTEVNDVTAYIMTFRRRRQ